MEDLWVSQRAHLCHLLRLHPDWTARQIADAVGYSSSMVSKWRRRFAAADPDDVCILFSRSRAPHHPPPRIDEAVQEHVRQIRLESPEGLQRTPGPVAILYSLQSDEAALVTGKRLPRSTRTIWRILDAAGLIVRDPLRKHAALEPPDPWRKSKWTSKMCPPPLIGTIPMPSGLTPSKPAILSMLALASGSMPRSSNIFTPRPLFI